MPPQANIPHRPAFESYVSFLNKTQVNLPKKKKDDDSDEDVEDKKHSPPSTPSSSRKVTIAEDHGTQTEAAGEDKDKETGGFKEGKRNDATTVVDQKTSEAQPKSTATSSSKV